MAEEEFVCTLPKVLSVERWYRSNPNGKGPNCPPCLIAPLASFYMGALEEAGKQEEAREFKAAYENAGGDILTIAKAMDKVRNEAGEDLKKKLRNFDCQAQSFKG